ncbi:unnamed protein product, partial [marine sediment metagenome]
MTEKKKAIPGRIIPERHYDSVSGRVLISMENIIDCYYDDADEKFNAELDEVSDAGCILRDMDRVRNFLEELRHCDEPLDP